MRKIKYFILICSLPLFFIACDDGIVEINSLQIFGDEFYYGETVNMGIAVKTSDPDNVDYHWECDGGAFLQRQGYSLNQWKAPNVPGVYKIKCTVTCGGKKQTREADLIVSSFFFEKFDANEGSNNLPSGWAQSNSASQTRNKRMELAVTTAGRDYGEFRYNFNTTNLFPPFSFKSDVGIVGTSANTNDPKYPNDSIKFGFLGKDNACAYSLTGNAPSATYAPTYFISELRLEWWPDNHVLSQVRYLPPGSTDTVTIKASDFDAMVRFQWTRRANADAGISQASGWYAVPFKTTRLKYGPEENRNVGMSLDEDYTIRIYVNGSEIFSSDAVKTWRADADNAPLAIKEYKYIYPAKSRLYVDNVYCYLDDHFGNN
jgi:hypothetical protein